MQRNKKKSLPLSCNFKGVLILLWVMLCYTNFPFVVTVFLRSLNDIAAISSFIHVRFLDLSNNHLTDLSPLASLTQLLWLKARSSLCLSI